MKLYYTRQKVTNLFETCKSHIVRLIMDFVICTMLENYDLQNILVLDIETVPQFATHEEVPAHMKELWAKKTLYQRKEETPEDYYRMAGILSEFGKIICISVGMFTANNGFRVKSFASHNEKELLEQFAAMLNKQSRDLVLCGHNAKEFDFPYICRRMLINGVHLPLQLQLNGKKPWEINHLDTMELWKCGDYKNFTSLNLLAAIFGIPTPKDDIDGSQVGYVYWIENRLDRICAYCQKDVIATAQVLKRFRYEELIPEENIVIV